MRKFISLGFVLSLCIGCGSSSTGPGTSGGTGGMGGQNAGTGGSNGGGTGGAATGGSSGSGSGGTTLPDGGATGGAMGGTDAGAETGGGTVACGTAQPDITGIAGAEGLVIGPDGTIYFSQGGSQSVGRLRPGAGMMPEKTWAKLPAGATTVWGVAYDRAAKVLYAGSPTTKTVYKITLEDTPTVTPLITMTGSPNGFTMGPDGALYYSDQTGGFVDRVASGSMTKTMINTMLFLSPNGVGFGPDGALYVLQYAAGSIVKVTVTNGMEQMRTTFVMKGLGNADGISFDKDGNLYIGFGMGLSKVSADGQTITHLMGAGNSANVEFGAGALSCKDIYFVNGGKLMRYTNDTEGAVVPWHVP